MKTLSYEKNIIALFEFLKDHAPEGIYSDHSCRIVFDYQDFHIIAIPDCFVAASQNPSDEMINAKFERIDSAFQPAKHDELIFQNKGINRLWILQTLLYFTDYVVFNSEAEALGNFEVKTETDLKIADLMKKSRGGYEEAVCHPESIEAEGVNQEFANLVDAGIMLEIDSQFLMCFSFCNGYGVIGDIMSLDEIKEEVAQLYKFIEI